MMCHCAIVVRPPIPLHGQAVAQGIGASLSLLWFLSSLFCCCFVATLVSCCCCCRWPLVSCCSRRGRVAHLCGPLLQAAVQTAGAASPLASGMPFFAQRFTRRRFCRKANNNIHFLICFAFPPFLFFRVHLLHQWTLSTPCAWLPGGAQDIIKISKQSDMVAERG